MIVAFFMYVNYLTTSGAVVGGLSGISRNSFGLDFTVVIILDEVTDMHLFSILDTCLQFIDLMLRSDHDDIVNDKSLA